MKFFEFIRNRFHPLHRLRKISLFREFLLPALDRPVPAKVPWLPHRWWVKRITHAVYVLAPEDCEPTITKVFEEIVRNLPEDAIFFDVGANIGKYTWHAASLQPKIAIHSFEPDASNFELLQKTLKECLNRSVKLHYAAISNHDGTAEFTSDAITGATGTLEMGQTFTQRHFSWGGKTVKVDVVRLDTIAHKVGYPSLIKIDVEGHEHAVFQGGREVFERSRPIVLFECFSHPLPFQSFIDSLHYVLFDADKTGPASLSTTNYWAVPKESPLRETIFDRTVLGSMTTSC
jgi:FkbM family methyltransferase